LKIESDKASFYKKPVQYFSTPKSNSKLQTLNTKTTEAKNQLSQQQPFRLLKKDFSKERSPNSRATSSFINKLTSPVNESKEDKRKSKELVCSKELLKYQSPSNMNSLAPKAENVKKSCTNFQLFQEKSTNSPVKPSRTSRYSDVHGKNVLIHLIIVTRIK